MIKKDELIISDLDQYLFGQGKHYEIYKKLGAHQTMRDGQEGVLFAVWAPNARYVSVVGEFNNWDKGAHPMTKIGEGGIWELFIPDRKEGDLYKYCVNNCYGVDVLKSDPFGTSMELRPGNASKVASIEDYEWNDQEWMQAREDKKMTEEPMFIYEVHPGSWKKHWDREKNPQGFYNYKEFAKELCNYVTDMGYTHVELMGIAEHPFDGSWGYQVTGYYAPTSRHGLPKDFMYLVNYLHEHGIGVILDWVPAHFPKDENGLALFDGSPLYEYADYQKANHPDWGTKIFDYGKNEVKNFLIANALYWVKEFHIDGLRVDAVASMLYLDFGRSEGQWTPNIYGDHRNLEAIEFVKDLNHVVKERGEGAMVIAEESTAWPDVTKDVEEGGLGFSFKWNMGWMNDFLSYMELDPIYRQYHQQKMNFSMMYAYNENFIQVLSHDEVVHLKHSMLEKMPGAIWDKVANLKGAYTFMVGHPGKKLLFMGQEFGQLREWSEERELDWFLLQDPRHQQLKDFMKDLIHLYTKHPAMYELDTKGEGFTWVNADDNERSIFSFERHSKDGKDNLLVICNFTPVNRMDYRVGAYRGQKYRLLLDSDAKRYGGGGMLPEEMELVAEEIPADNRDYSIGIPLPAYGAVVLSFDEKGETKKMNKIAFGVDVGGTSIKFGLFEPDGNLLQKWEVPTRTENKGDFIIDDISNEILKKLTELGAKSESVIGIGIGVPGPVDDDGIVQGCVNLGWGKKDVALELGIRTGMKIRVGNDANVAALGEAWQGAASGTKNSIMVTLGTGVGGGIILNEKILAGSHGAGGEIGHMKVNDEEILACNCGGHGCLEQYVSATGIVRMANGAFQTAKDVFDAAKDGDETAKNLVAKAGDLLGKSIANICCVCDPETIVIGGGVSKAGEILRQAVETGFQKYAFHACKDTKIVLASLGNDAGIYGCAKMIL